MDFPVLADEMSCLHGAQVHTNLSYLGRAAHSLAIVYRRGQTGTLSPLSRANTIKFLDKNLATQHLTPQKWPQKITPQKYPLIHAHKAQDHTDINIIRYMKYLKLVRFSKQISNVNISASVRDDPSKFSLGGRPQSQLWRWHPNLFLPANRDDLTPTQFYYSGFISEVQRFVRGRPGYVTLHFRKMAWSKMR